MTASTVPTDRNLARVRALALPLAAAMGVDLVAVEWTAEGGRRTLRVTIERKSVAPTGAHLEHGWGVTLDDCADLSRQLSQAIDAEDAVPGAYDLEVSSPGLDRPLYTAEDYRRFVGQLAKAKLAKPAPDGQRLLRGHILSVEGSAGAERVTIDVDGKAITVPFADVVGGHLVFELSHGDKPGHKPGKKGGKQKGAGAKRGPAPVKGERSNGGGARPKGTTTLGRSSGTKANVRSES